MAKSLTNNRRITFVTGVQNNYYDVCTNYVDTRKAINKADGHVVTSDLTAMSFDLLDNGFDEIYILHESFLYELRLGENAWTNKTLRPAHNLLKLVTASILSNSTSLHEDYEIGNIISVELDKIRYKDCIKSGFEVLVNKDKQACDLNMKPLLETSKVLYVKFVGYEK